MTAKVHRAKADGKKLNTVTIIYEWDQFNGKKWKRKKRVYKIDLACSAYSGI